MAGEIKNWVNGAGQPMAEGEIAQEIRAMGYEVTRYVYPPGAIFPPHSHRVDKMEVVLAGRFQLELEGRRLLLAAGQSAQVAKDALHSAQVVGPNPAIVLDCVRWGRK